MGSFVFKREICFLICTLRWRNPSTPQQYLTLLAFPNNFQTHFQTTVDDENKLLVSLHDLTVQLSTVTFLEYLLPGQSTLLFQWFGKTLTYGTVCQFEHQSNIMAQTYLILTTFIWHWFTFKHQNKSSNSAIHWE